MDEEEQTQAPAGGALAAFAPPAKLQEVDADPKEILSQVDRMVDPSAKWDAYSAGALKPARGGFGESMSNALGALAEGKQKEAELRARYLPLAESAVIRRQQAELRKAQMQQEQAKAWTSVLSGTAASLLTLPQFGKQDLIQALQTPVGTGQVPPQVAQKFVEHLPDDPAQLRSYLQRMSIAATDPYRAVAQPKGVAVPEGAELRNPLTGEVLGPPAASTGKNDPEYIKLMKQRDAMPVGDPRRDEINRLLTKLSTHAPAPSQVVNMGEKGFKNELQLKSDFRAEPIYKDHADMTSAYQQIRTSLKQGTPISDMAAATKIMKLLDPGSVVRESELGLAMAASGKLDRLKNYAQMWISGERLTEQQRKDFGALADELFRASTKLYNTKRGEYEGIAKRYDINTTGLGDPAKEPPAKGPMTAEEAFKKFGGGNP